MSGRMPILTLRRQGRLGVGRLMGSSCKPWGTSPTTRGHSQTLSNGRHRNLSGCAIKRPGWKSLIFNQSLYGLWSNMTAVQAFGLRNGLKRRAHRAERLGLPLWVHPSGRTESPRNLQTNTRLETRYTLQQPDPRISWALADTALTLLLPALTV